MKPLTGIIFNFAYAALCFGIALIAYPWLMCAGGAICLGFALLGLWEEYF